MKFIKSRHKINENSESEFQIPDIIWKLNDIFNKNGHKLYVVGGAVRDFKTGDIPKDFDLCTDAVPDRVIEILKPYFPVRLQGEAFGVVVVDPPGYDEMEIATFRVDLTKGRNPEVKVGGVTIEQDVLRRDISINGLFFDLETKEIIDLVGGVSDLENRVIRMIGNPMERIEEDPLRILRVFRFACRYGSKLDERTSEAIHKYNDISEVSMERVWNSVNGEFFKSFKQSKDFQQYLNLLSEFGIMEQILPDLNVSPKVKNRDSVVLVLAQMLKNNNINKLRNTMNKIAIPGFIIDQVCFLLSLKDFNAEKVLDFYKSKVRYKVDDETIKKWISVEKMPDHDTYKFILFKPSVTAQDVMDRFNIKPGPELGKKIKELEVNNFNNL